MWIFVTVLPLILADKITVEIDVSKNFSHGICVAPNSDKIMARKDLTLTQSKESFPAYMYRKLNKDRWHTFMKNIQSLIDWMDKHKSKLGKAELEELPSFNIDDDWIGSAFSNIRTHFIEDLNDSTWETFQKYVTNVEINDEEWRKLINWIIDYEWIALYYINDKEDPVPKVLFTKPPLVPFDSKHDKFTFEEMVFALL